MQNLSNDNSTSVAVGYLRFAGGDKLCPYFVTPGVGGESVYWSDCLDDNFNAPLWKGTNNAN